MKVLVKEINGDIKILDIEGDISPKQIALRGRLASYDLFYITNEVIRRLSGNDDYIIALFKSLHKDRRDLFFPSVQGII